MQEQGLKKINKTTAIGDRVKAIFSENDKNPADAVPGSCR